MRLSDNTLGKPFPRLREALSTEKALEESGTGGEELEGSFSDTEAKKALNKGQMLELKRSLRGSGSSGCKELNYGKVAHKEPEMSWRMC